jgi:hypothetical protein
MWWVCHIPPGNPENCQTLCLPVGETGHLTEHDDVLGECPDDCYQGGDVDTDTDTDVDADADTDSDTDTDLGGLCGYGYEYEYCGTNKVMICHDPHENSGSSMAIDLCVSINAACAHIRHRCFPGPCVFEE